MKGTLIRIWFVLFVLVAPTAARAQIDMPDTIYRLPVVNLLAEKPAEAGIGSSIMRYDSSRLKPFRLDNLSGLLSSDNGLFVKTNGPGRLSTPSVRGAAAVHTPVLWNGLNLQSPMLGLLDLSLIPLQFFEEVQVQRGGNSALWGANAMGGVIHLQNELPDTEGFSAGWQGRFGSFQRQLQSAWLQSGGPGFSNHTRAFIETAANNYPFKAPDGSEKRLSNSALDQWGLMQQNRIRLSEREEINTRLWVQQAEREIPPTTLQRKGEAREEDGFLRALVDWQHTGDDWIFSAQTAWFGESLEFSDPQSGIFSDSRASSLHLKGRATWTPVAAHRLSFQLQHSRFRANSTGYSEEKDQQRSSGVIRWRWQTSDSGWQIQTSVRQERINDDWVPFIPSVGLTTRIYPWWQVGLMVNRNYRVPGFDDLYWSPGGNPDLLPEEGWGASLNQTFRPARFGRGRLHLFLNLYSQNFRNRIIWLPGNAFWSPENLGRVWSRGAEAGLSLQRPIRKGHWEIRLNHQLTLSTNETSRGPNDRSLGKQLIYTPVHGLGAHFQLQWQGFDLGLFNQYNSRLYTTSDHSSHLPGFWLTKLSVGKDWKTDRWEAGLRFRINNLFDQSYEVVAFRPMPGIHYEIGFNLAFHP